MTGVKEVVDRALKVVCVTLFALLVVLVTWQVFTRLVLDSPSAWSEAAARYTFVWVSLLGIAIATGEKADVVMDFLVRKLPTTLQRGTELLAYLATLAFAGGVMVWGGSTVVETAWEQTHAILPFTVGQLYLALPIGGGFMCAYLLFHLVNTLSPAYAGIQETAAGGEVEL